jgi:hypothetical protein
MGTKLFIDGLILPDREPVLLASHTNSVKFYTRSSSSTILNLNSDANSLTVSPSERILDARFLRTSPADIYLTVVKTSHGTVTISIYPVILVRKEIGEHVVIILISKDFENYKKEISMFSVDGEIKESESMLSQCLVEVRRKLGDEGERVKVLNSQKHMVITVDKDLKYTGRVVNPSQVIIDSSQTSIRNVHVLPQPYPESN